MSFWSLLAIAMAALALWKSWVSAVRARQALATTDELISLIGEIAEQRESIPAPAARADSAPAAVPRPTVAQALPGHVSEDPARQTAPPPQTTGRAQDARITPELRAVVPGLYGQGTPVVEIARRSGLSRGEVKMLIALDQRLRREAL
jgi:hypothetical protein